MADAVEQFVQRWRPQVIIHTAYRKDVASIVDATRHVAAAAHAVGARLIHVSSDAIFAGRPLPYHEDDEPDPVHDYGRWKAAAEHEARRCAPSALVVRTSLLYSRTERSVHDQTAIDAADGVTDIAFFTDELRNALFADDLAAALVRFGGRPAPVGVLNLAGPVALSRAELATYSCERHGRDASVLRFSTIERSGLRRPGAVALDSSRAAALGVTVAGPAPSSRVG